MNMTLLEDQMVHGAGQPAPRRGSIEHATPIVPAAIARGVCSEAAVWLGTELPRSWAPRLVARAETLFGRNASFRRRLCRAGDAGRDWLWAFMRHWLSALIWRQRPDLHDRLPASYRVGHPLPPKTPAPERDRAPVRPSASTITASPSVLPVPVRRSAPTVAPGRAGRVGRRPRSTVQHRGSSPTV
jgi:hypothetical protein